MVNKLILCDTRQKIEKNEHINVQLSELGYKVERTKLYCGDYTFPTNQAICIDTKANINEVENNLIHDHERFKNECIRAKEAGIKLIILIQDESIKTLPEVFTWKNPRRFYSKKCTTGRTLGKIMMSMNSKYGVEWEFTKKELCGKRIIELLGGVTK